MRLIDAPGSRKTIGTDDGLEALEGAGGYLDGATICLHDAKADATNALFITERGSGLPSLRSWIALDSSV